MATAQDSARLYVCGVCKAEYARADHLIRHVRSHTRQHPFVCSRCGRGFGRQDLLKRHLATHNTNNAFDVNTSTELGSQNSRDGAPRVNQACRSCAEKKLKCTDEKPCKRCKDRHIMCDIGSGIQSFGQTKATSSSASRQSSNATTDLHHEGDGMDFGDENSNFQESTQGTILVGAPLPVTHPNHGNSMAQPEHIIQDILGSTLNFPAVADFTPFDYDSVLEDVDFSFLNTLDTPELPSLPPMSQFLEPTPPQSTMAVGAEAYQQSSALNAWTPRTDEDQDIDQQDLFLPHNVRPSPRSVQSIDARAILKKELSHAGRDQILAMILQTTSRAAAHRIASSFPSVEVMGDLIHHAFLHLIDRQIGNFIHVPSFNMNKQRPELLGALLAYGSVSSPSPSVRKFGYALQETVRLAIIQLVQEDHAALRELGVAQAFYIQLYLGYYSGINRKIEMAESISMLGATMLRRGKRLRTDHYYAPDTFTKSSDLTPQQKWLRWVEQESFKRVVYFAMSLDFHVAAARRMNTVFTYDEMGTPLPTSTRLWKAAQALEWLDVLSKDSALSAQQPLALSRVLRLPHHLTACTAVTDRKFTAFVYLSSFWALIEEHWRMNSLMSGQQIVSDFVLNSRHSELLSILEQFKAEFINQDDYGPEILILQELVFLHLHVSFNEISCYSGRGTEDDARAAAPYVQRWYQSSQSRAAVWHAGQIFRATKLLPAGALADIYSIAIYHAGLILWIWGLLRRVQPAIPFPNGFEVMIDGEETPEVMKFLKAGRCQPSLTDKSGEHWSLEDPAMVTDLAQDIIAANWGSEALPLTTEETFRFMQAFSKSTRQRFGEVRSKGVS